MPTTRGTIYRKGIQRCLDVPRAVFSPPLAELRPPVIVTAESLIFESTLLPRNARSYQLVVPMAILRKLGRDAGDFLEVDVRPDPKRDAPPVPIELSDALRARVGARKIFEHQTISIQRQIVRYIDSARSEATRISRAEAMIERILDTRANS